MKRWLQTQLTGSGTDDDPHRASLGGFEQRSDVSSAMYELGRNEALARVDAPEPVMGEMTTPSGIETLQDRAAHDRLRAHSVNPDLAGLDKPSGTLDTFLRDVGHDPDTVRQHVESAPEGQHLLQAQELAALHAVATEVGADICSGPCAPGAPCARCERVVQGRGDTHRTVMADLRSRL